MCDINSTTKLFALADKAAKRVDACKDLADKGRGEANRSKRHAEKTTSSTSKSFVIVRHSGQQSTSMLCADTMAAGYEREH
ncbi:hypothetical protein E2562_017443 [Oryza meyeriana var. granulata]|uniref:Uncharacterized protein n=1 Tax=Oryza meyeriana var. granulata TaxID=110450 RepID=A0A6G1DYS3_9ORYZ|nr:hypothetical protein E2562_017443 [Oryza meyeriana var. granulata]